MADRKPEREDSRPEATTAADDNQDLPEDTFLTESFSQLAPVQVPPSFLPQVMFRVRERRHRDRVKPLLVLIISGVLTILGTLFIVLDVMDYGQAKGLSTFGSAFTRKCDLAWASLDRVLDGIGGLLSASWQIVVGAVGMFLSSTSLAIQILLVVAFLSLLFFLFRSWLTDLAGR